MVAHRIGGWQARAMRIVLLLLVMVGSAAAAKGVDEGAARALLAGWLDAQNSGNAKAYNTLYAGRFFGVKRVGAKTWRFDRKGWVRDRRRMFERKMRVEASEVRVSSDGRSAVVRFVQTWASGTFKDVGPKQLVLVREGGAVRIAREEMLASERVGEAQAKPLRIERFAFVLNGWMLLHAEPDERWATGAPKLVAEGPYVATKAVAAALPDTWRAWVGREVTGYDAKGGACDTKITELVVVTGFHPHFGTEGYWTGHPNFNDDEKPVPDDQIADEVFAGGGPAWLAAKLADDACAGSLWAHPKRPTPATHAVPQGESLKSEALRRFRTLKGYRSVAKLFRSEVGAKIPWEVYEDTRPRLSSFSWGGRKYVAISAASGPGCGGFSGEFWAIYGTTPDGKLQLLTDPDEPGELFHPSGITDIDGDGRPDFVSPGRVVRQVGATWRPVESAELPSFDCPC